MNCERNHSWESDGQDSNYFLVRGPIRLGLIKDLSCDYHQLRLRSQFTLIDNLHSYYPQTINKKLEQVT